MTDNEKKLLTAYEYGKITWGRVKDEFPANLRKDKNYIASEIQAAIKTADADEINLAMLLIWVSDDIAAFTGLLNELLLNPHHKRHQEIARTLQDIRSPGTVPFVEKVLETHFDFLAYTCSDSDAIAKWFSWLLAEIGTPEAIAVLKRFAADPDEGIQKEMQYRLKRIGQSQ